MTRRSELLTTLAVAGVTLGLFVVFVGLGWWKPAALAGMATVLAWIAAMVDVVVAALDVRPPEGRYAGTER